MTACTNPIARLLQVVSNRRAREKNRLFSSKTARTVLASAAVLLSGCVTTGTAPATVKEAVPEAPCKADVPARPTFQGDTLTGDEDIFTIGTQLWAERKSRQAYELKLEIIAAKCTGSPALP